MTTFYWAANESDNDWFLIMIMSDISNRSSCGIPLSCSLKLLRENEKSYYWIILWISYSLRLDGGIKVQDFCGSKNGHFRDTSLWEQPLKRFFGLSAHRRSQLWSVDIKRDMSHTVTAEIIKAYLLLSNKKLVLTGKLQYLLVIFGSITIYSF